MFKLLQYGSHTHIDHVSGVRSLLDRFSSCSIQVVAHLDDQFNRENLAAQSQMLQFPYSGDFDVSLTCSHGDNVFVGDYSFNVLHTPGHALGHVAFFMAESTNSFNSPVLISGDTLFKGSIGRTDLPGGNHDQLIASIQDHIFTLPEDTVVCSGHGPNTTIGNEKQFNPFFNSW